MRASPSILFAVVALHGCAQQPTATEPEPGTVDMRPRCAQEIQRQIRCKESWVPTIVDTRIKLDLPEGIAEQGKDADGRDGLVATAMQEFERDYTPEKIPVICERRQAQVPSIPPAMIEELQALSDQCMAQSNCEDFSACFAPLLEKMLAMGAKSGAA